MDNLIERLTHLVGPVVNEAGYEFWGCELHTHGRHSVLKVYIDKPSGVGLEDCERVSRQLSAVLDVEDPIMHRYDLEVSSPGFDRALFTKDHYQRYVGSKLKIKLGVGREGRHNFTGILQEVKEEGIKLTTDDDKEWELLFSEIEKANVVPDYSRTR